MLQWKTSISSRSATRSSKSRCCRHRRTQTKVHAWSCKSARGLQAAQVAGHWQSLIKQGSALAGAATVNGPSFTASQQWPRRSCSALQHLLFPRALLVQPQVSEHSFLLRAILEDIQTKARLAIYTELAIIFTDAAIRTNDISGIREKSSSTPLHLLHADTWTARLDTAPVTTVGRWPVQCPHAGSG